MKFINPLILKTNLSNLPEQYIAFGPQPLYSFTMLLLSFKNFSGMG
jgi:hypothetical protein